MKVLFVNPPRYNMIRFALGSDSVLYGNYQPPLGLLYVATAVKQRTDHEVRLFDLDVAAETIEALRPTLEEFQPDVVAMTSYTFTLYDTYETCKLVKRIMPEAKIVLGGAHVDVYPYETMTQPFIDLLVKGEGDVAILEVLEYFEGKRAPESIAGIYYRDPKTGTETFTGEREKLSDIDAIPFPDRTLLGNGAYFSHPNPAFRETTMVSSRGCPYKCNFCNIGSTRYRYRTAKNVVDEMEYCAGLGYNYIQFVDDTFNLFDKKVKEMCRDLIRRQLPIKWCFRGRVDKIDEEMCELFVASGCIRAYFGVESGNPDVLASIGKQITIDQTREAFRLMNKYGIETVGYFMIGFPDETPAQMEETIRFASELKTGYAQVLITTPLPDTRLYEQALREGGLPGDYMRDYALNPVPNLQMIPWNKYLSTEELLSYSKRFYRKFYFRPGYVWRQIRATTNPTEFMRKAQALKGLVSHVLARPAPAKAA